jgi:hypothetical protein
MEVFRLLPKLSNPLVQKEVPEAREREREKVCNSDRVSFGNTENLWRRMVVMAAQLERIYTTEAYTQNGSNSKFCSVTMPQY